MDDTTNDEPEFSPQWFFAQAENLTVNDGDSATELLKLATLHLGAVDRGWVQDRLKLSAKVKMGTSTAIIKAEEKALIGRGIVPGGGVIEKSVPTPDPEPGTNLTAVVQSAQVIPTIRPLPALRIGDYMRIYPDEGLRIELTGGVTVLQITENLQTICSLNGITFQFNMMTKEPEIIDYGRYGFGGKLNKIAVTHLGDMMIRCGMARVHVAEMRDKLAWDRRYHPLQSYLWGVEWDGVDRVQQLMDTVNTPDKKHLKMVLIPWLVSVIAAVWGYGDLPMRGVLVFIGNQNAGKTGWVKLIAPNCGEGTVITSTLELSGSRRIDSIRETTSALIVELGELDYTFKKSEIGALKAFIGATVDKYRTPYDIAFSKWPRQTVFFGSVNEEEYLHDTTGNTRYWTVDLSGDFDFEKVKQIDNRQLWAQVRDMYLSGTSWLLGKDDMRLLEAKNEEHIEKTVMDELLEERFDWDSEFYTKGLEPGKLSKEQKENLILFQSEALATSVGISIGEKWKTDTFIQRALSKSLKRLTGMKKAIQSRHPKTGKNAKHWVLPPFAKPVPVEQNPQSQPVPSA